MRKRQEQAASAEPQRIVKLRYLLDPGQPTGWLASTLRHWKYKFVFSALMMLRFPLWQLGYAMDMTDVFTDPNANALSWGLVPYHVSEEGQAAIRAEINDTRQIN